MSDRKVNTHDLYDTKRQVIGIINNARRSGGEQQILPNQQKIGRINNEPEPHMRREIRPEEREIGVINNEKGD